MKPTVKSDDLWSQIMGGEQEAPQAWNAAENSAKPAEAPGPWGGSEPTKAPTFNKPEPERKP